MGVRSEGGSGEGGVLVNKFKSVFQSLHCVFTFSHTPIS